MLVGEEYINIVKDYFRFLTEEFGFQIIEEKIRSNTFYDVRYRDSTRAISVSYENIEDYLQVIVFMLQNGKLPDYDDKSKTLHLNHLNKVFHSKIRQPDHSGSTYFKKFGVESPFERKLFKSAKELRFCLYHFDDLL